MPEVNTWARSKYELLTCDEDPVRTERILTLLEEELLTSIYPATEFSFILDFGGVRRLFGAPHLTEGLKSMTSQEYWAATHKDFYTCDNEFGTYKRILRGIKPALRVLESATDPAFELSLAPPIRVHGHGPLLEGSLDHS